MRNGNRRSAPKVRNGAVALKNNQTLTRNYYNSDSADSYKSIIVDKKRPGKGYRHLLGTADISRFIEIVPDWEELSKGLNAIVLAPGDPSCFGGHYPGVIEISAWPRDLWIDLAPWGYLQEQWLLDRLEVPVQKAGGRVVCQFTENTARAHQLLATLLHEIGHHHDRMTTKSQDRAARGEPYAENYAYYKSDEIWESYIKAFPI